MKRLVGMLLLSALGLVDCGEADAPPAESSPTTLPATTTAPPAQAADTDAAVAALEKLGAKITPHPQGGGFIVDLSSTQVTDAGVAELTRALPNCSILHPSQIGHLPQNKRRNQPPRKPNQQGPANAEEKEGVAEPEKLVAKIKNLMTDEQVELGGPIVNSVDMVLVPIPAGEFLMGSPETEEGRFDNETQHKVRITKPFYLSAYEVTQAQYEKVMGNNSSHSKGANKPVEKVNWSDAVEFCRKLSDEEGAEYRLPTEAEWEYACRAGTATAYSFGDGVSRLGDYAWHRGNSDSKSHPVGEKLPNNWGLFDMHGNVREWCQDWYGGYETEQMLSDPVGAASGSRRVLRGGAFFLQPLYVRAAYRPIIQPVYRIHGIGIRLARTCPLSP